MLRENFPEISQLDLPGYEVTYSRSGRTFATRILAQIPKIFRAISREREWLRKTHATHQFDLVISDNRYGLKIDGLKSVIMTHQLQIMTGFGFGADWLLRKLHYRILEKFDECWVVDREESGGLAGALSHPIHLPVNARYVGLLSQMRPVANATPIENGRILILLSGPEPMRGILEQKLLQQLARLDKYHFHIIAGNPAGAAPILVSANVTYATHANANDLTLAITGAELVVCRSGYSTLMDLAVLGKKALLVPTPGQSEQVYLAKHLQEAGLFLTREQAHLELEKDIPEALRYPGFEKPVTRESEHINEVIDLVLKNLK
ncbi:glycosyl transferase [Dyadobacter sp. CY261]|uniref:glycosyltransferase n=1 Tax=Dyadobacter sp. CY261 TaxID=2907203 RepID=UPI001F3E800F|nr:glycosyltransferase [Dyadobacter sp. CY261]MCF0071060.1 glycosyl transferase [Dyadobacter sp. CY261]